MNVLSSKLSAARAWWRATDTDEKLRQIREDSEKRQREKFWKAVKAGDANECRRLLNAGVSVNAEDANGMYQWTALSVAAMNGHVAVVALLLDKGASVDTTDDNGFTPLMWAADDGHAAVVALLLENGASINATDRDGDTPLMGAAIKGHAEVVALLLDHGSSTNVTDEHGHTALMWAAHNAKAAAVSLLLAHGASMNVTIEEGGKTLKLGALPPAWRPRQAPCVQALLAATLPKGTAV